MNDAEQLIVSVPVDEEKKGGEGEKAEEIKDVPPRENESKNQEHFPYPSASDGFDPYREQPPGSGWT